MTFAAAVLRTELSRRGARHLADATVRRFEDFAIAALAERLGKDPPSGPELRRA
jgi:hypothetical protein